MMTRFRKTRALPSRMQIMGTRQGNLGAVASCSAVDCVQRRLLHGGRPGQCLRNGRSTERARLNGAGFDGGSSNGGRRRFRCLWCASTRIDYLEEEFHGARSANCNRRAWQEAESRAKPSSGAAGEGGRNDHAMRFGKKFKKCHGWTRSGKRRGLSVLFRSPATCCGASGRNCSCEPGGRSGRPKHPGDGEQRNRHRQESHGKQDEADAAFGG